MKEKLMRLFRECCIGVMASRCEDCDSWCMFLLIGMFVTFDAFDRFVSCLSFSGQQ